MKEIEGDCMINKLGWKIGGEQGEGLESTAEIFSTVINKLGYHILLVILQVELRVVTVIVKFVYLKKK